MPSPGVLAARRYDADRQARKEAGAEARKLPVPKEVYGKPTKPADRVGALSVANLKALNIEIEAKLRAKLGHKRQLDHAAVESAVGAGVLSVLTTWLTTWSGEWDDDGERFRLAAHNGYQRALDAFKKEDQEQRRELTVGRRSG